MADQVSRLGLDGFYEVLSNEIRGRNGTKFIFTGLSNLTADALKSYEGIDVCWAEESHKLSQRSIDLLLPTIRKPNSQLIFTFNPELDTDEVWVRFIENQPDNCIVKECSWHNNPWFPDVLEQERQEFLRMVETGARTQADYDWVWEGKTKPAVDGAIYVHEIAQALDAKRLTHVPYDPTLLVHTVWDLGWNDKMAIIFVQKAGSSIRVIDYIEDSHRTYDSYVRQIKAKDYNLGTAWLPHDGRAKNPQTGKSPIELLTELGLKTDHKGVPDIGLKAGIEATRQMFPRVLFDKGNCSSLFNRLRRYARVISPTTDEAMQPKKDENCHGADAFRYVAVIEKNLTNDRDDLKPIDFDNRGII